jgi:aminoglycoside 6'-N-acetyltransferase
MLLWLETPHVKAWWDTDVVWTPELIHKKFGDYIHGFKWQDGVKKPMHAFIIHVDGTPIGYIQAYNAYDFPRDAPLTDLPPNLAAFDMFIGDANYLGKNIGSQALHQFISTYLAPTFTHVLADPDPKNLAACASYEKAGFTWVNETTMLISFCG